MLTVGKSMLAGFDEQLIGMTLGETREFDLLIPENGMPSLVGKVVHFKIILNMGSKTEPTPLDDTLAQRMGKTSFAEVEEFVGSAAMGKAANMARLALNEAVANYLVAANHFVVPNWMAVSEAKYLAHNSKLEWDPLPDLDKEKFLSLAEKNVKLALILDKVRETEPEAQLTDQEVFDIIKQNLMKTQTVSSVDDTMREMNRTGYLQILFSRIKDEYSLDFVAKNMKIVD
jgi:trigger factor